MRFRSVVPGLLALLGACSKNDVVSGSDSGTRTAPSASPSATPSARISEDAGVPANGSPWPIERVLKVVNPEGQPVYSGPVGSVEGTITVTGAAPKQLALPVAERRKCNGDVAADASFAYREDGIGAGVRGLRDALVYAVGYEGIVFERNLEKHVSIKGCVFDQRTVDVTFGQALVVKNEDKIPLGPSLSKSETGVLSVAAPGGTARLYPAELGPLALGMRLGPSFARATVYVLPHPLHTTSEVNGRYRIDGIPVGAKINIRARHSAFSEESAHEVEIRGGVVSKLDLELQSVAK